MRTGFPFDALRAALPPQAWHLLTSLGDSSLLLPAALLIALVLAAAGPGWQAARRWVLCFGAGSLVLLASKLAFMGWCAGIGSLDFTGFSGHTALSASIWPVAFWLMATRRPAAGRRAAAAAGLALAALVGASRLAIDVHSTAEVAAGWVLGAAVSTAFLIGAGRQAAPRLRWRFALPVLLLPLMAVAPAHPAPTQSLLERIAVHIAGAERACTRIDLRSGA